MGLIFIAAMVLLISSATRVLLLKTVGGIVLGINRLLSQGMVTVMVGLFALLVGALAARASDYTVVYICYPASVILIVTGYIQGFRYMKAKKSQ